MEKELTFHQIVDGISALITVTTPDGEVEIVNQQVLDFGKSLDELKRWTATDAVHLDDLPGVNAWKQFVQLGHPYDLEHRIRRADGAYRWFHLRGLPVRDADARILRWFVLPSDIDERKRAEALLAGEKRLLEMVAAGDPLPSILDALSRLVEDLVDGCHCSILTLPADPPNVEGARETARRTIRDAKRASAVIKRLRALFAKRETRSLDLNEATREVIALSLSELQRNRATLRAELAEDLPPVTGDRIQLQQVVLNLLLNASQAMRDVYDRPRELLIRTERDEGQRVRLTVRDVGVGFEPQDVDRMFEAFYTTKSSGMGIGLSVSRSIIESHRSRIWAAPNDGPGARLRSRFLAGDPRMRRPPPVSASSVRPPLRMRREPL